MVFHSCTIATPDKDPQRRGPCLDPETDSSHQRLTNGEDTRKARCLVLGTPGLGGGSRETTGGNIDPAPVGLPHPSPNTPATPRQIPPSGCSTTRCGTTNRRCGWSAG